MANRTSPEQVELMVAFMEKHGDLNRAHQNRDRLQLRKLWGTLTARLGALTEQGGRPKSLDKWKKTWSDIKNNTKRKAARIAHPELRSPSLLPPAPGRAALPPLRLSRLDVRVLVIMGLIQRTTLLRKVAAPPPPPRSPHPPAQNVVDVPVDTQTYEELEGADPLTGIKAEEVEFDVERAASDEEFNWPEAPVQARGDAPDAGGGGGGNALQEVVELMLEEEVVEEPEVEEQPERSEEAAAVAESEPAPAPAVRPDTRGHTSTRGSGGARRGAGAGGLRRALAALLRAEAARTRRDRDRLALHRNWQRLCAKGLALLERLVDRSECDGNWWLAPAAGTRESEEWEERPLHPCVLHPDRPDRPRRRP